MKLKKEKEKENTELGITATCLDCDWQDSVENADTDPCGDYDDFKGVNISTKLCPKCGGGVELN